MRPGRIVLVVAGVVLALVGLVAVAGGGTLLWANATQRDASGYYNTTTDRIATQGYALTASVDFGTNPSGADWVPDHPTGTVRIRAADPAGRAVFVGIAPASKLDAWLTGVPRTRVRSLPGGPFDRDTVDIAGTVAPGPPAAQTFWVASSSGSGPQTVVWPSESGRWGAVVMNADGRPRVVADVTVGVHTGLLLPVGIGLAGFGILVLAGSVVLLVLGLRSAGDGGAAAAAGGAEAPGGEAPTAVVPGSYPVRLDGRVDPATSGWLWIVKWLLVLPHVIVLAFLWLAVFVLTVVAGFAILFTGRYPRSVFEFNLGVFRWTWRVGFYSMSAFGTDRYPPFSLQPDPAFPADLSIDYPARLSRPLVLVKWWLLALPQYLIVAILVGGWGIGWSGRDRAAGAGGLIALLAVIAAVIRAFRGRYPEQLFDLIMGLNRWCYRVLAYAALMTDDYPPFRLDSGGTDPGHQPAEPPPPPRPPQVDLQVSPPAPRPPQVDLQVSPPAPVP